jgi:hypothetical protein
MDTKRRRILKLMRFAVVGNSWTANHSAGQFRKTGQPVRWLKIVQILDEQGVALVFDCECDRLKLLPISNCTPTSKLGRAR